MARVTLGTGESITVGGDTEIFGTSGAQNVTILDGSTVTFRSGFNSGGDTIRLNGTASDFVVSFSGSNVTLLSVTDGITIVIPIGLVANTIVFDNGDSRTLSLVNGVPTLGAQTIPNINNAAPAPVTAGAGTYTVEGSSGTEGENVTFTVTRTDTTSAETLNFTVQGDTANGTLPAATLGADVSVLSPNSGTVVFAAGAATATITVRLSADTDVEGLEGYKVVVLKGSAVVAEAAAVIIDDNEGGQVFNLTSGVDRVGTGTLLDIEGSAGNTNTDGQDTIVADTGTLNPFDVIDGGDEIDTLIVLDDATGLFTPAPSFAFTDIENVEILNYSSASRGFAGGAFNTTLQVTTDVGLRPNWEGLTQANIAINGGPTQTVTLRTDTNLNIRQAGDGDLRINGGGGILNVIAADFSEDATTGDVNVGFSGAANEWTDITVRGGDDITIVDQGDDELTTVALSDFNDDFTITGGVLANVSITGIDDVGPGSDFRTGNINSDVAVTVDLSVIDDLELDLNSSGPALIVNADGATIALDSDSDISSDGTLEINSLSGTFAFDDAFADESIALNAAPGAISLDNVDSGTGVVTISGEGAVDIDTVIEVAQVSGTVITSTNSGGVNINDQLGNNTKFIGTESSGDDSLVFGATDRANSFGAGDDVVVFNADAFGNDAVTDGDNGAFDGGDDYDTLVMESNDADTFTATAKAVTNFEELVLTGQDLGKADVIDLHNIGMDTVSNVTSNVGNGSVPEITTLNFTGSQAATGSDTVTITGAFLNTVVVLADGDTAATIAQKVAAAIDLDPDYTATVPFGGTVVTVTGPNGVDSGLSVSFGDSTSIGTPTFEQVTGSPVVFNEGVAADPGRAGSFSFTIDGNQLLQDGQSFGLRFNATGDEFLFTAVGDLSSVGGEVQQFIADAANADPDFSALFTTSVGPDGSLIFTSTTSGVLPGGLVQLIGTNTLTFNPPGGAFIDNGADPIPGETEDVYFQLDGITTGNDSILFDDDNDASTAPIEITFSASGLTAAQMALEFINQYNNDPDRVFQASAPDVGEPFFGLDGGVELNSLTLGDVSNITANSFTFVDDTNVGTPSVVVTEEQNGELASVTLNNFVSGSRLTLTNTNGIHTVNMKTDTVADVLNLVLAVNGGDHGVVTVEDAETVNINTGGIDASADVVDLFGGDLTTLVISGTNGLTLDTDSTIISSIDATGLGGEFTWAADDNTVAITVRTGPGGSDVDFSAMEIQGGNASAGTAPITFIGGSGDDIVTTGDLGSSRGTITTGGGNDVVFVGIVDGGNDFWSITDFDAANDELDFAAAATFLGRDQELEPTAIFQDYLDQAARGNTADGNFTAGGVRYFWYDEDGDGDIDATYVVQDNSDSEDFVDGSDTVIRLEGQITLDATNFG